MDNNLSRETRHKIKEQVSHFIEDYEHKCERQERQKQQLKKNVMLTILQNRHKLQQDSSISPPKSLKQPTSHISSPQDQQPSDIGSSSSNYNQQSQTFENGQEQGEEKEKEQQSQILPHQFVVPHLVEGEITFSNKKINSVPEITFKMPSKEEIVDEQESNPSDSSEELYEEYEQKYNKYIEQKNSTKSAAFVPSSMKASQKLKKSDKNEVEQEIEQEELQRGGFLTMPEDQSVDVNESEVPKNHLLEFNMGKSMNTSHLEKMKHNKIMEIQKRNEENRQEFRRNQSQKKQKFEYNQSRTPNLAYSNKIKKQTKQEEMIEAPKPPKLDKKTNRPYQQILQKEKPYHQNPYQQKPYKEKYPMKNTIQSVEQVKSTRPSRKMPPHHPQPNYSYAFEEKEVKAVSPFRTPKTILSETRGKSANRATIFQGESPFKENKSKAKQPRIQPKERKNSFTKQSNRKLMVNAITYVCFPGELNRKERERLLQVIEECECQFFIFLFKEFSRKIIKGIYTLDHSQSRLQRIYGDKAPFEITADRVKQFYRFDSGCRDFKKVDGCRSFSFAVHAIDLR